MTALRVFRPAVPSHAEAFPRLHLGRPLADGSIPVSDRVLDARYRLGVVGDRWYVRDEDDDTASRRPFRSIAEAISAIRDGTWDLVASHADRRPVKARARARHR